MTKQTIQIDKVFLLRLARSHDDLKKLLHTFGQRLDHLESHIHEEPEPTLHCNVLFKNAVPPKDQKAFRQQFEAELVGVFREYGVEFFEGLFRRE